VGCDLVTGDLQPWICSKGNEQQQQIPFGNDNKKGNSKDKSKS
jgi:hypothetical protein